MSGRSPRAFIRSLAGLGAALLLAAPAQAEPPRQRTLSVQGEGRVGVTPDSVRIMVGIETLEPTLAGSRTKNAGIFAKVASAVARAGVPGVLVKSDHVRVELVYESSYPQNRLPNVLGYRIFNSVTVRAKERDPVKLSKAGSTLLDRAVGAGANRIQGVEFFVEDTRATYKRAMLLAIEDARKNAADMARSSGVSLGSVQSISPSWGRYYPELSSTGGSSFHYRHAYTQAVSMGGGGAGLSVAAGIFQVKASVSMIFEVR